MASRFLICEDIEKKAEEDLLSILISENPDPMLFNYSPYILRRVNEKLLNDGKSIGLGYISDRSVIDSYWKSNPYRMKSDLKMRIVYGTHCNSSDEVLLFLKNCEVKNRFLPYLDSITELRIRNEYLYRFRTQIRDSTIDDLCEKIRVCAIEEELQIETEIIYLTIQELEIKNKKILWTIPENFLFKCLKCNYCEYPSNYSANPIPNNLGNIDELLLTFENRVCFPCNLPSLSYSEIMAISQELGLSPKDFSRPILGKEKTNIEKIEVGFSLKQHEGLCIFQEIKKKECKIYDIAPFNCRFYPFLLSNMDENNISIEVDFSCPGVGKGESVNLKKARESLQNYFEDSEFQTEMNLDEIEKQWGKQKVWKEGERVTTEDVKYSKSAFFS